MSRSRPSRSQRLADEAAVTYEIATPFASTDAKIHLLDRGEAVEVLVADVPVPFRYHTDYNYPAQLEDETAMRTHATARWLLKDAAAVLETYGWETSSSRSNNPNRYLRDVYFTCDREAVDDAVLDAKRFLVELEEKVVRHSREFDVDRRTPSDDLDGSS